MKCVCGKVLKLTGHLRQHTSLEPVLRNETRWSGNFQMVDRYLKMVDALSKPEISNNSTVMDDIPTARENSILGEIHQSMQKLNSVTLALQKENTDISDIRILFDEIIKDFPGLASHCGTEFPIVHNKDFENALVKNLNNREEDLKDIEKDAFALLKCSNGQPRSTVTASSCSDFAKDLRKKRKLERKFSEYMKVNFILPTSNLVERFFSTATYAYSCLKRKFCHTTWKCSFF